MGKPPPLPPRRDQTSLTRQPQPPEPPKPPPPPLPADYLTAHSVPTATTATPVTIDYGSRGIPAPSRQAMLTAIGVISIVIGIFEIIGCFAAIPVIRQLYANAFDPPSTPTWPPSIIVAPQP
jgi:hypothetical protein